MQSRRSFMRALAGLAAGLGLARLLPGAEAAKASAADETITIRYVADLSAVRKAIEGVIPPWGSGIPAIQGVPGETYFLAAKHNTPDGMRVYLDGADVHMECGEADLVGGWVRLLPVRLRSPEGIAVQFTSTPEPFVMRGNVELRPVGDRKPRSWQSQNVQTYRKGRFYETYRPCRWDAATRKMVPDGPTHLDVRGKLTPWDEV